MSVFTLFLCIAGASTCQANGGSHATIEACYDSARRASGQVVSPSNGRLLMPNGNWYECRRKYLDAPHR
jgi:hypothetical protein